MRQLRIVPLSIYGALCYLLGLGLIVAPFVLDIERDSGAFSLSVLLGVALLVVTLVGRTPVAAARWVPLIATEAVAYLLAIVLVLFHLPNLDDTDNTTLLTYVGAGLVLFVLTLAARFPRKHPAKPAAIATAASETVAVGGSSEQAGEEAPASEAVVLDESTPGVPDESEPKGS